MRRPLLPLPSLTETDPTPPLWLGANFWSRSGGPRMWSRYDPELVREELAVLRDHGLTMTRSFFYWPDFHPEPYRLDEDCIAHFHDFLDAHHELGMTSVPTFIVGHMSGENWDPAWRDGRDLYRDAWFVGRQAWYVNELTARFHRHPAVSGWLLTNEVPIYGGEAPRESVNAWVQALTHAIRAAGATQPISVGDGAWGLETTGHDNGFSVRDLTEHTQFTGPHVYRMESDQIRQNLKSAFITELCHISQQPVVLEEFGVSSDYVSPDGAGHYYRQQLYNTLLAGATGWIAWNNTDYDDLVAQRPYSHHPFEMHFGITDSTGRPKPALHELQAFSADLQRIGFPHVRRTPAQASIVLPSHLAEGYPSTHENERQQVVAAGEQAYVAAREAHLPVSVVREDADGGLPAGDRLYLIPSIKQLCGPSWKQLFALAEEGATVYVSYCVGETSAQRGPWWAYTEELFGVQRENAYGLIAPITDDEVQITLTEEVGGLARGTTLRFAASGNENSRAFLPVSVSSGTVLAEDAHGNPALVSRRHGRGRLVLCTYPLEYMAAQNARVNPDDTWRLYDALGRLADVTPEVQVDDPHVFVDVLEHDDGSRFAVFVSQHAEPTEATARVTSPTGQATLVVSLEPYGTAVHQI